MKSFWAFISNLLNAIIATVMVIVLGIVSIIAMPILACLFIIVLVFGLFYYLMGGKLPDIFMKEKIDKD